MVHYDERVTIQRPIEEVFGYLADVERLPEWVASIQRSTVTSPGPVGEGTTFVQTLKLVGRTFEAPMEVHGYQPPRRFEFARRSGPMRARIGFDLTPEGAGTRVVLTFDGDSAGFFKLGDPLLARLMAKQALADLETLKTLLESEVAAEAH
jgi:carbon monoxide dehydrogenase subunit G